VEAENHTGVFWVLGVVGSSMLPSVSLLIIVFQTRSHDMPTPPLLNIKYFESAIILPPISF
jgi:hypothetical protein